MTLKKIAIADASTDQLRKFANENLGMSMPPHTKRETMLAKISAAWPNDEITVDVPDEAEPIAAGMPPRPATAEQAAVLEPGKIKVRIAVQDEAGGRDPVPVGVNGRVMVIHREQDSAIPYPYFEVLQAAVKFKYEANDDGNGLNPIPRKVLQYPYSLLSSQAEVEAAKQHWLDQDRKAAGQAA